MRSLKSRLITTLFPVLLSASLVIAAEMPSPPLVCGAGGGCPSDMAAIAREFREQGGSPDRSAIPHVFSGECYHQSPGYDPAKTHYGVTLLDLAGEGPSFSALFGFFYDSNPWGGLSVEQARVLLKERGSHPTPTIQGADFLGVQFLSSTATLSYWIRQNSVTHDLLMQHQGVYMSERIVTSSFCRMRSNPTLVSWK